ncbi:MAG: hypothetical protein K8R58_09745, partial [Bacteroidales bacterium]|nr:hypothetical protein [Bacteroidales bacterium]
MDIWTAIPEEIIATYQPSVPIGSSQISFITDALFARIALIQNGEIIGRALTDENGNAVIDLFNNITSANPISVSIIGHNKIRHQGTIEVISDQPYVIFDSYQINDVTGNGNGLVDFGESISLDFGVVNIGNMPANDVDVTISTVDDYITLTDDTEFYGNFAANQTIVIDDAYSFDVANDVPDGHIVNFNVIASGSSDETWNSFFTIDIHAPTLEIGSYTISDPNGNNNGRLDPGETVDIIIESTNSGSCDALNTIAYLSSASQYITLNSTTYEFNTLEAGETDNAVFNLTVNSSTPIGTLVDLTYSIESGMYENQEIFMAKVGLILEDWESGGFEQFNWEFGGNANWEITSVNPYEGVYCAKSGDIGDNQNSELRLEYEVQSNDSISFYIKVSSE